MSKRNKGSAALLWAALGLVCCQPNTARAQTAASSEAPGPAVSLTRTQAANFQDALMALAEQGRMAIVAEGVPLHSTLPKDKAPDIAGGVPLGQAISRVADAYDYAVERQDHVLILKKRYTDPEDLPGVTLDECRQSLDAVVRVLDAFNPHLKLPGPIDVVLVQDFTNTLTPEQEQAMQAKTLHYSDLAPGQQALIVRTILYENVQSPSQDVQNLQNVFAGMPGASVGPIPYDEHGVYGRNGLRLDYLTPILFGPQIGQLQPTWYDLTSADVPGNMDAPTLSPRTKTGPAAPQGTTVEAVVAGLNARPVPKPAGPLSEVEAPLKAKPVTVAGLGHATPLEVLRALAAVYGLRIGATDKGGPLLERVSARAPTEVQGLPDALRRALPEPFLRAIHDAEAPPPAFLPPPAYPPGATPAERDAIFRKWRQDIDSLSDHQRQAKMRIINLHAEAARRLKEVVQPKLRQAKPGVGIPVSSLDAKTRDDIGLLLMAGTVANLHDQFLKPGHEWMTADYNQMLIWGRPVEDPYRKGRWTHTLHAEIDHPETHHKYILAGLSYDGS